MNGCTACGAASKVATDRIICKRDPRLIMFGSVKGRLPSKFRLMNGRAKSGQAYIPTDVEHLANVISHGVWIIPSLFGMLLMIYLSATQIEFVIAVVYGGALLALFTVSTTFHTISYSGKYSGTLKNFFHISDRAIIYVFIAASYTPWLALKDMGWWGVQLLWLVWFLAVFGITYQYVFHEQYKWLEIVFYLLIGICPSAAVFVMKECSGVYELALGGITYMSGVVFFKCDGIIPFAHAIWHCFVPIGALFHYYAVCMYLLGSSGIESSVDTEAFSREL